MKAVSFFALLMVLIAGCESEVELVTTFTIPKGEHYSVPRRVQSLQDNVLRFRARLNGSAIYDFGNSADQSAKNKLLGFSDCNSTHHENSARFAWQWFDNELQIFAYCYVNGERVEKYVATIPLNEYVDYSITLEDNAYRFQVGKTEPVEIVRGNTCDRGIHYLLWPYFGGGIPAPHDVSLELQVY